MAFHVVMMQQKQPGLKSLSPLTVYQKYQRIFIVSELSFCFLSVVEYKWRNSKQCLFHEENYDWFKMSTFKMAKPVSNIMMVQLSHVQYYIPSLPEPFCVELTLKILASSVPWSNHDICMDVWFVNKWCFRLIFSRISWSIHCISQNRWFLGFIL